MANLIQWITEEASGEPIEAVVIGPMSGWRGPVDENEASPQEGIVLSWEEAKPLLDYEFDSGFGAPKCHSIAVWTATKVIAVSRYDGSTDIFSIPRHPIAHDPVMPGGG